MVVNMTRSCLVVYNDRRKLVRLPSLTNVDAICAELLSPFGLSSKDVYVNIKIDQVSRTNDFLDYCEFDSLDLLPSPLNCNIIYFQLTKKLIPSRTFQHTQTQTDVEDIKSGFIINDDQLEQEEDDDEITIRTDESQDYTPQTAIVPVTTPKRQHRKHEDISTENQIPLKYSSGIIELPTYGDRIDQLIRTGHLSECVEDILLISHEYYSQRKFNTKKHYGDFEQAFLLRYKLHSKLASCSTLKSIRKSLSTKMRNHRYYKHRANRKSHNKQNKSDQEWLEQIEQDTKQYRQTLQNRLEELNHDEYCELSITRVSEAIEQYKQQLGIPDQVSELTAVETMIRTLDNDETNPIIVHFKSEYGSLIDYVSQRIVTYPTLIVLDDAYLILCSKQQSLLFHLQSITLSEILLYMLAVYYDSSYECEFFDFIDSIAYPNRSKNLSSNVKQLHDSLLRYPYYVENVKHE
ncbi:unnamed protein product [Didymodactylos carnosus]|uniref:Uncharacterized protein n=1 Tax=Didymodactylos carnosus TaxID=1234261 RepID=A0A815GU88_9BILA|nr:unnamed protein product [Didymodactylos carnosus]CAF1344894.1 unnamed protein product [Didymodactylos carnosus]CAF3811685.1 unnamed protein product [Didymodactylos carnosus]CAF4209643.1 unnamed protein product [Didymodactylos carnosus]